MEPKADQSKAPESKPADTKPPEIASASVPDTLASLKVNPDTGLPIWGRRPAEPCISICTTPAGSLLAGVSFAPVCGNGIAGTGEPFLVAAVLFQGFGGKELRAVAGGMTERFQQACRYEPGNLVRFKTEKPRRLGCVEPGGNDLPTEKFGLLGCDVHTWMAVPRARRDECFWV
jgi:hypothetical protein